ncbi:MAG: hypothetical protein AB7F96_06165 [Beijerinckiaceae bacterium]
MIMRTTDDFKSPIAARVRFCATNFTGPYNSLSVYVWTTGNPWEGTPAEAVMQVRPMKLGECLEIDHPSALVAQNATLSGVASGYYELLEPTALPPVTKGSRRPPGKPHGSKFEVTAPRTTIVACKDIEKGKESNNFLRQCHMQVVPPPIGPSPRGIRICTGAFNATKADGSQVAYPAGYLEMIVNKAYLPPTQKPSDYDHSWSPLIPNGCRDVFKGDGEKSNLNEIYFMVAPKTPTGGWDASTIASVNVTTQFIYYNTGKPN